MLTSQTIKNFARETLKVDKIAIANIGRFKDAPPDMSPLNMMPEAKSVICFAQRIIRGTYRGIDEGTHWPSYQVYGYSGLNDILGKTSYRLGRFIEKHGYEAMPVPSSATIREFGPRGKNINNPDTSMPPREITISLRIACAAAGLGEIGWSKVFITEEFGPRQRVGIILTDVELEPDPIIKEDERVCDGCRLCSIECPGGEKTIRKRNAVEIEIEGVKMRWNDIDIGKCKLTHFGLNRCTSPHLIKQFPGLYMPIEEQQVSWLEAWDLGWAIFPKIKTYQALAQHPVPICGARGCIIACMKHLETKGVIKNKFKSSPVFSTEKPWRLPAKPEKANHKGFVYNPEYGTSKDGSNTYVPPSDWY